MSVGASEASDDLVAAHPDSQRRPGARRRCLAIMTSAHCAPRGHQAIRRGRGALTGVVTAPAGQAAAEGAAEVSCSRRVRSSHLARCRRRHRRRGLTVYALMEVGTAEILACIVLDVPPPEEPLHMQLMEELAATGIDATRISQVLNVRRLPDAAIQVLVRHLDLPHEAPILSAIVRCLADKDARKYQLFGRFVEAFIAGACPNGDPLQEALAVALGVHATKHDAPALLYAVQRPGNERYLAHLLRFFRAHRVRELGPILDAVASTIDPRDAHSTLVLAGAMVDIGWPEGLAALKARQMHVSGKQREKLDARISRLASLGGIEGPDEAAPPAAPRRS